MIQAILFDLDGVLVNAAPWHAQAFREALQTVGVELSASEHAAWLDGLPTKEKVHRMMETRLLAPAQAARVMIEKQRRTKALVRKLCRPDLSRQELLCALAPTYRLGCVTNCTHANATRLLEKAALRPFFPVLVTQEDAPEGKPHPALYHIACQRLFLDPGQVAAVEDNPYGLESASQAGCHVYATTYETLTNGGLLTWLRRFA